MRCRRSTLRYHPRNNNFSVSVFQCLFGTGWRQSHPDNTTPLAPVSPHCAILRGFPSLRAQCLARMETVLLVIFFSQCVFHPVQVSRLCVETGYDNVLRYLDFVKYPRTQVNESSVLDCFNGVARGDYDAYFTDQARSHAPCARAPCARALSPPSAPSPRLVLSVVPSSSSAVAKLWEAKTSHPARAT